MDVAISQDPLVAEPKKADFYIRRYEELLSFASPLEQMDLNEFYELYHGWLFTETPQKIESDEVREEFGAAGGFEMLALLLPHLFSAGKTRFGMCSVCLAFLKKAVTLAWLMTVAYEPNKYRAALILRPWCEILQECASRLKSVRQVLEARAREFSDDEMEASLLWLEIATYLVHGVWSFCYGVLENHRVLFDFGAVASLAELFNNKELVYPVAGTFWHMCESSFVCEEVLTLGLVERLSELPTRGKDKNSDGLLASLALSRMSLYGSIKVKERLVRAKAFEAISAWVQARDPLVYKNFFVWTSTRLLTELLESQYYEVRLLGCFFVAVILRENATNRDAHEQTQGKLLFEGVASMLFNILQRDHCPLILSYATLGISNFTALANVEYYRSNCMLWNLFQNRAFFESDEIVANLAQYEVKALPFVIGMKDENSLLSWLHYDLVQYILLMLFSLPNESGLSLSQSFAKKRKLANSNSAS